MASSRPDARFSTRRCRPPRAERRPALTPPCGGVACNTGSRPSRLAGRARAAGAAGARRERALGADGGTRGEEAGSPARRRGRPHDVAARVGAARRRGSEAACPACAGSRTCATRSSRMRTAVTSFAARRCLRGSWPSGRTRSSASRARSPTRCAASTRAGRWPRSATAATSRTSRDSRTGHRPRFRITHAGSFLGRRRPRAVPRRARPVGR